MPEPLWACERCKMAGTYAEAKGHEVATGHAIHEMSDVESVVIRQLSMQRSAERAAGFIRAAAGREADR